MSGTPQSAAELLLAYFALGSLLRAGRGRARPAASALREAGVDDVVTMKGHMRLWLAQGLPTER